MRIQKHIALFLVLLVLFTTAKAQIFFNNGAIVHVDTATKMQINGGLLDDNAIGGPGNFVNDGTVYITSKGATPGNVHISNKAILQGNGIYHLDQDWINDAVFIPGASTVDMYGNLKEFITSNTGVVTTFDTLILHGTGTNMNRRKQQTLDAIVNGALLLNDRVLFTGAHTMFVTNPNINAVTNNNTYTKEGFVASTGTGSLSRVTNSNAAYFYPVGADSAILRYRYVTMTPSTANANTYTVRLADNDATNDGDSVKFIDTTLCKVNPHFYHKINRTSGTDSADIAVYYDPSTDGIWYELAQWNTPGANLWNNLGAVLNTVGPHYNDVLKKKWMNFSNDPFILGASLPVANISGKKSFCIGENTTLSVPGGGTYVWSTGDTTTSISVSPVATTKYYVTVSNGECSVKDSATVFVNPLPVPNACCDSTIIHGQSIQLTSSGGASYSWSPSTGLSCTTCPSPIARPAQTTTYMYTVTSDSGCTATDSVTIVVICRPSGICCDSLILYGETVQLNASGGSSYSWNPSTGLSCDNCDNPIATPLVNTTYTVTINDSGCVTQRTLTLDITCGHVFIPDAFSPNGDGQNDVLYVRGPCIKTFDFIIFDRWGNKMFESSDPNLGWNGEYKGQPMNSGTYAYYITAEMNDGSHLEKKGNVTLVR
ncbi:MAG TPA: gliding motility-associated C-terminal domain-containing protein [Bacteroidia bacterium]|jgi:gliding motility-associated-like protein|nr:gliding motility-associated C-terminal domain-containing protein [Bacteroidia bacterium]